MLTCVAISRRCIAARTGVVAAAVDGGQADWKFNFRIKQRQPSSLPLSLALSLSAALYNNNNNNLLRSQRCESEEMRCNSKVRLRQMENKQQYCSIWRDGQLHEGEKAAAVGGVGGGGATVALVAEVGEVPH